MFKNQTTFPSAPNKVSSSPSTAGQLRCTRCTARPPRASTASHTILRVTRLAWSSLFFCRSGLWLASTRARFSGSASAVSESCLLDSMTFVRSSRAAVRYLTWIAKLELELIQSHMAQKPRLRGEVGCACVAREVSVETTSRPRSHWACFAQGSAACGVMRPFSTEVTSS